MKASTPAEHTICADAGLAQLDVELASAWKAASRVMTLDHAALVEQQRAWVAARDPQTDPAALQAAYAALGLQDVAITQGPANVQAVLHTPKGLVTLNSDGV